MTENDKEVIMKKAKYFLDTCQIAHVLLKNGHFYNGIITYAGADFILINDRKLGETPCFFLEIVDITQFWGDKDERN